MTKKAFIKLAWFIVFFGGSFGAQASAELSCPPTVVVSQKAAPPPPGWDVKNDEAMRIDVLGITFYLGPPSEMASLHPREHNTVGKKYVSTWSLYKKKISGIELWMECSYTHTNVVLSKRVPDSIKECSVFYDKDSRVENNYVFDRMECK